MIYKYNERLREPRNCYERDILELDLSAKRVADILGVSTSAVYGWLSGKRKPKDWEEKRRKLESVYPIDNLAGF